MHCKAESLLHCIRIYHSYIFLAKFVIFGTAFLKVFVGTKLLTKTQPMDFQLLSAMKVEDLKAFLSLQGLKVNGRKEELVARAFVAFKNNVLVVQTAEEVEEGLACQYTTL